MPSKNQKLESNSSINNEIKKAKKRRDIRTIVLFAALGLYVGISFSIAESSEFTTAKELLLPLSIGITVALLSMIYSENNHYETTKQLIELGLSKRKKDYKIPSSIEKIKFIPEPDIKSFIKNFDILLSIQLEFARSVLPKEKRKDLDGLILLCEKKQDIVIHNLREMMETLPPPMIHEFENEIDTLSYTNEMINLQMAVQGESLSNDEKLEAVEEVSDSIKGAMVRGANWIKDRSPNRVKGIIEKTVSGIDIIDEIINLIRKVL